MSDIQQRIADIIRAEYDKHAVDRYPTEHKLAEVLVSELGLTQEWKAPGPTGGTRLAGGVNRLAPDDWLELVRNTPGVKSRYVTKWVPDD